MTDPFPDIPGEFSRLTEAQRNYALGKTRGGMSQSDSYRAAYPHQRMTPFDIGRECNKLNNHPVVSRLIYWLQNEEAKRMGITKDWVVRWHWMRATYNSNELTTVIVGACEYCHGEGHQKQWREKDYMEALKRAEENKTELPDIGGGFGYNHREPPHPDCPVCNGSGRLHTWFADTSELSESARAAFDGVEVTKDGIKVRMADKDKAMERVAKLMGLDAITLTAVAQLPSDADRAAMTLDEIAQAYKRVMES